MGGISFFASLLSLLYLSISNPIFLYQLIDRYAVYQLLWFIAGILLGCWLADLIIRGHLSVLLHELKHSAVSNLVGNKFVSFVIRRTHGHFKYKYTKDTAKYNAIIALAPYFFPIITLPGLSLAYVASLQSYNLALLLCGVFFGADLLISIRDIGEHQSDFSEIRGGYIIGLLYVICMNISITSFILAFVMQGWQGIKIILYEHLYFWTKFLGIDFDLPPVV